MKILISKPDSLGDQIIAAGFVQQLLACHPEATIFCHVRSGMEVTAQLVENTQVIELSQYPSDPDAESQKLRDAQPGAIHFLPFDLNPFHDWNAETIPKVIWWRNLLSGMDWDLALSPSMNRNWLSDVTIQFSKATRRIGFAKNPTWQPLGQSVAEMLQIDLPVFTTEIDSDQYASEYEKTGEAFSLAAGSDLDVSAIALRPKFQRNPVEKKVVILPGVGVQKERAWPTAKWQELSSSLAATGWKVSWIEGPLDAVAFEEGGNYPNRQRFELDELTGLAETIASASLVICNDTAYAHIAAAIGVPCVSLFGCGQGERFFPMRGQVKIVQGKTVEEFSQWHDFIDVWASIGEIPVDEVQAAIREVVDSNNYLTRYVAINLLNTDPQTSLEELRRVVFEKYMMLNWDNWSRLQLLKLGEVHMKELLAKLEEK